jgi:hypothetical protein
MPLMNENSKLLTIPAYGDSMAPLITGEMWLEVRKARFTDLAIGDLVSVPRITSDDVKRGKLQLVTHRVIGKRKEGWVVKGDNNVRADRMLSPDSLDIYQVVALLTNTRKYELSRNWKNRLLTKILLFYSWLRGLGVAEHYLKGRRFVTRMLTGIY